MRLRQIEVFHAVYTCGSVTGAAEQLNVTQPSVSKVLAHAEQQLGYPLFDRVRGKLIATPEAHELFRHVSSIYRDVDRLRHVAANLRDAGHSRLRIATTPALGVEVAPAAVARFRAEHKDAQFELETLHLDAMADALFESRIDLGFAFERVNRAGVDVSVVGRGRFFVLVPADSDLAGRDALTVPDLEGRELIALNDRSPLGKALSAEIGDAELNIVAWTETYSLARALVARGAGITIADQVTAGSEALDDLRAIPLVPPVEFDITCMHASRAPLSVGAHEFVDTFSDALNALLGRLA